MRSGLVAKVLETEHLVVVLVLPVLRVERLQVLYVLGRLLHVVLVLGLGARLDDLLEVGVALVPQVVVLLKPFSHWLEFESDEAFFSNARTHSVYYVL